jgi:hypothetical protein
MSMTQRQGFVLQRQAGWLVSQQLRDHRQVHAHAGPGSVICDLVHQFVPQWSQVLAQESHLRQVRDPYA